MLTKYKFLLSNILNNLPKNGKNFAFKSLRFAKFSTQPDIKSTVLSNLISLLDNHKRSSRISN